MSPFNTIGTILIIGFFFLGIIYFIIALGVVPSEEKKLKKMYSTVGAVEYDNKKKEVDSLSNKADIIGLVGFVGFIVSIVVVSLANSML
jgi:preprotein translocase subunit Sss1